jgi:hypothetical protein
MERAKLAVERRLGRSSMRTVIVRSDAFQEIHLAPIGRFDIAAGKVSVIGKGDTPATLGGRGRRRSADGRRCSREPGNADSGIRSGSRAVWSPVLDRLDTWEVMVSEQRRKVGSRHRAEATVAAARTAGQKLLCEEPSLWV